MDESQRPEPLSLWSWTDHVVEFDRTALVGDVAIALATVACLGYLAERRRRRRAMSQVTLRDILCATAFVAVLCAYVAHMHRSTASQVRAIEALRRSVAPQWRRSLDEGALQAPAARQRFALSENEFDGFERLLQLVQPDVPLSEFVVPIWETQGAWFWETFCPSKTWDAAPARVVSLQVGVQGAWPEGAEHSLSAFKSLRALGIMFCNGLPDEAVREIGELRGLEELALMNVCLSDDQLPYLAPLRRLRRLDLSGNQITNEGLSHLHGLKRLETLHLSNTAITDEGVSALQRALPNVQVLDD